MNNPGSLFTRKQCDLKGKNYLNHRIQKFAFEIVGKYIPLLYLKEMIFTYIYWKAADDHC